MTKMVRFSPLLAAALAIGMSAAPMAQAQSTGAMSQSQLQG